MSKWSKAKDIVRNAAEDAIVADVKEKADAAAEKKRREAEQEQGR